jgi:hypothetical protein
VTNGADVFSKQLINTARALYFPVENEGGVTIYFDIDDVESIASGDVKLLNPTAYVSKALLKGAVRIEVSEDANTVTTSINDKVIESKTFGTTGDEAGNFKATTIINKHDYPEETTEWSKTIDIGLDVDELLYTNAYEGYWHEVYQVKITPIDMNGDGLADKFHMFYARGTTANEDGVLEGNFGEEVTFGGHSYEFTSYEDENWNEQFSWALEYNPFLIDSALSLSKSDLSEGNEEDNGQGNSTDTYYIDGLGLIEFEQSKEDLDAIVANTTTSFDAFIIGAEDLNLFEDEDNFLDVNAALTLEAVLGDYEVKVQLSGNRTAFDEGKFDLELTYNLPGEDAQRSFTVHANTEEEGKLTANNFEGVVLVLEEPDEDAEGVQVIGRILVGPTAIVAATIEDRDGLIVIVYSNDDEDTVNEVETL